MLKIKPVLFVFAFVLFYGSGAFAQKYKWYNVSQHEYMENLVACQLELKKLEWSKTLWPESNKQAKPSFDSVMSVDEVRRGVLASLHQQATLAQRFNVAIEPAMLQNDLDRMVRDSRDAATLNAMFALFENDATTIAHCISRPFLVETKLANAYYWSAELHDATLGSARREIAELTVRGQLGPDSTAMQRTIVYALESDYEFIADSQEQWAVLALAESEFDALKEQLGQGSTGLQEHRGHFSHSTLISQSPTYLVADILSWRKQSLEDWLANTHAPDDFVFPISTGLSLPKSSDRVAGARSPIGPDTWAARDPMPAERVRHTAVWTGTEMIVWGGTIGGLQLDTGSRYTPATDSWREVNMTGAPIAREQHSAVWTGTEMVIWGGRFLFNGWNYLGTGGRYDPVSDTWVATSVSGAPSPRGSHAAVWTGQELLIWGGYNGLAYLDTGNRYNPTTDAWQAITSANRPSGRLGHTAVWAGEEMIVWGGSNMVVLRDGKRYNPSSDQWQTMTENDAPIRREDHSAIWTGAAMIVWGGRDSNMRWNTGGVYSPVTDTWQPTSLDSAPAARSSHSAIWTGTEMLVWAGRYFTGSAAILEDGGRYNPDSNSWSSLVIANAPSGRDGHSSVWTGSEMIVWGGLSPQGYLSTGGRFDPATNIWQPTDATNSARARSYHSSVWTGMEMIVWGGEHSVFLNDGGRYRPATDSWSLTSTVNAPSPRAQHAAVWTGTDMIVWGGRFNAPPGGLTYYADGARYRPLNDLWLPVSSAQAPTARFDHGAVWTGELMLVWGGRGDLYENSGARYDPQTDAWSPISTASGLQGRSRPSAVWTGNDMIAWGGWSLDGSSTFYNNGAKYDPSTNTWQGISSVGAPTARQNHSAVWTGQEMIIWGGGPSGAGNMTQTGGRYNPTNDTWTATTTVNAPSRRSHHTAVWTGQDMIVWGGVFSDGFQQYFDSGGVYDPVANAWTPTSLVNAPRGRRDHGAVWTGAGMLIWGGNTSSSGSTSTQSLGFYFAYGDSIFSNGFE